MSKVNQNTTTYRSLSKRDVVNVKTKSPNLNFKFFTSHALKRFGIFAHYTAET